MHTDACSDCCASDESMNESKMMEIDPPENFLTKDDEIRYWMEMAYEMSQRNEVTTRELQEYQENSQYVEKELELSFLECDQKNRSLSQENCRLLASNEELRRKLNEQIAANVALQKEMQTLREKNTELLVNVRNLEQKNDDLERDNRALKMIEDDMESRYNDAIEKIALLETDLLEDGYASFDVDRLKKENEELKNRIENLLEQSKSVVRTRTEINQVRLSAPQRSSYNMACTPFNLITERQREPEPEIIVNVPENNLVTLSPIKLIKNQDATPKIPQLRAIQATRKQKYNTEGRDLSQAFAHYNQQQEDKQRSTLDRSIEVRSKKIKDEEKRQRLLSSFVKRLRNARNQLLRRND